MADNKFSIDYAKREAGCKKCKAKITKGEVRIAKHTPNPFNDDGDMKMYHHPACIFETFKKARATTKKIEDPGDLEGWEAVKPEDRQLILQLIREFQEQQEAGGANKGTTPKKKGPAKTPTKKTPATGEKQAKPKKEAKNKPKSPKEGVEEGEEDTVEDITVELVPVNPSHKDNSFRQFQRICSKLRDTPSYLDKTELVRKFFKSGTDSTFQGDLLLWVRLLLPGIVKRIYNMQNKQMVKVFNRIFLTQEDDMLADLEEGDVAETVGKFFERSKHVQPREKSDLSLYDVDRYLVQLSRLSREEEQQGLLARVVARATRSDLVMFVRLMKGDLKIQAGAKPILDSLHPEAYSTFNSSRNITKVVEKVIELRREGRLGDSLDIGATLLQPVQPMLAMACKSVDQAFQKCPNGIYSEIKYDGERVQLHKKGNSFKYFSRSLKPVMSHKVKLFEEFIPKAFPGGSDLILDSEVLMVNNKTGKPLPFGSLGVHKGSGFEDANPCLFIFDCLYYNGENLMNRPLVERRKLLEREMKEVGNRVKFSEIQHITKKGQLTEMIRSVFQQGLEGLVLKDLKSQYEPGKRHWLKVKKDYLNEGAMADTADLVVLGGWFGSGQKGGLISIFLMGCQDTTTGKWCTVTKVHTGHDDATLDRLQAELRPLMTKVKGDYNLVPAWLTINRPMVPDFLVRSPDNSPVWEITGAEFSRAEQHTAAGISIRFPRVTKIRQDKTAETATSLQELERLFTESKQHTDIDLGEDMEGEGEEEEEEPKVKKAKTEKKNGRTRGEGSSPVKMAGAKRRGTPAEESSPPKKFKKEPDSEQGTPVKIPVTLLPLKLESEDLQWDDFDNDPVTNGEDAIPYEVRNMSKEWNVFQTPAGFSLSMVGGDLFGAPAESSLCHCVSRDMRLGAGIAKIFRERFGRVDELEAQQKDVGDVAVLRVGNRFIYNLVTKEIYKGKPTFKTLELSLLAMLNHAQENNVTQIAMPKIACGLDGLKWPAVQTLIRNTFCKTSISITVYVHEDNKGRGGGSGAGNMGGAGANSWREKEKNNRSSGGQRTLGGFITGARGKGGKRVGNQRQDLSTAEGRDEGEHSGVEVPMGERERRRSREGEEEDEKQRTDDGEKGKRRRRSSGKKQRKIKEKGGEAVKDGADDEDERPRNSDRGNYERSNADEREGGQGRRERYSEKGESRKYEERNGKERRRDAPSGKGERRDADRDGEGRRNKSGRIEVEEEEEVQTGKGNSDGQRQLWHGGESSRQEKRTGGQLSSRIQDSGRFGTAAGRGRSNFKRGGGVGGWAGNSRDGGHGKTSVGCGYETSNPLPNILTGVRVFSPEINLKEQEELHRHLVGFGGKWLDSQEHEAATHILYSTGMSKKVQDPKNSKTTHHVLVDWLEETIKKTRKELEKNYAIP